MGWSSGTRVFDTVVGLLLNDKLIEEKIEELILELEDMDWDNVCESDWYDHPLVHGVIRKLHPSWFEEDED